MSDEIEALISRYLDGIANAAEIEWLDAEVRCNPASSRALFLSAAQDTAVREILAEERYVQILRSPTRVSSRREIVAQPRSRWAAWAWSCAAISACMVAYVLIPAQSSAPQMRLEASDDRVIIRRGDRDIPGSNGCNLKPDDVLIVPEGTGATVVYPNQMRLDVGSGSTLVLGRPAGANASLGGQSAVSVFLKSGAFTAGLIDSSEQTVFYAPDSESLSSGGNLKLQVGNGQTRLEMRRGNVQFLRRDVAPQLVRAGESLLDNGGATPVVRPQNYIDLQRGLVALWNFHDGSLKDESGNGNDCKLEGAQLASVEGKQTLQFNKPGAAAVVENSASLNVTGEVTVAAWINLSRIDIDQKVAGMQDNIAGGYKLSVYSNNKVDFLIRDRKNITHTLRKSAGGTKLKSNQWYHVVGLYSETDHCIKIYVNGVIDRSMGDHTVMPRTSGPFVIGREPWANGDPNRTFNGMIDEVRVYNRVLNEAEIAELAQRRMPAVALADTTIFRNSRVGR